MINCEINILSIRYRKGKLRKINGLLKVKDLGECNFIIKPHSPNTGFYDLKVKGEQIVLISNFKHMIQLDWEDRSMIKWIGQHGPGMLTIAQKGV